jgi:hypothetical protein
MLLLVTRGIAYARLLVGSSLDWNFQRKVLNTSRWLPAIGFHESRYAVLAIQQQFQVGCGVVCIACSRLRAVLHT